MQLEGTVLAPDPALASTTYTCTEAVTLGDVTHPRYLIDYLIGRGRGKLGSSVAEAVAHVRVQDGVPAPDFQILFAPAVEDCDRRYSQSPDRSRPPSTRRPGRSSARARVRPPERH